MATESEELEDWEIEAEIANQQWAELYALIKQYGILYDDSESERSGIYTFTLTLPTREEETFDSDADALAWVKEEIATRSLKPLLSRNPGQRRPMDAPTRFFV